MLYWAKRNEHGDIGPVYQTDENYVPDGDGFEIEVNDVSYPDYQENPDEYEVIGLKLVLKE